MPIPRSTRTLLATATIALMAGCSGTSQLAPTVGGQNAPQSQQSASQSVVLSPGEDLALRLKKVTKTPMVWITDAGTASKTGKVYGYLQSGTNQAPTVTITNGLTTPYGNFIDKSGNLYVADVASHSVYEYLYGQTTVSATYHDNGETPNNVTVCPDGTVYIANSAPGSVTVYAGGSHVPTSTITNANYQAVTTVACDKTSNLYVGYLYAYTGPSGIDKYAPGGTGNPTTLPAQDLVQIFDMALTKTGDIVATDQNSGGPTIRFYHLTSKTAYKVLKKMFTLGTSVPYDISYSNGYTHLYVADGGKNVILELNPGTGAVIDTITKPGYNQAVGVATFPIGHP